MRTLKIRSHVDQNGILQIQLPDYRDEDLEILVVYQPAEPQKRQWSEGVLNAFGAWQGEPLVRAPQGDQAERDAFL
ncbi:hypothetical protein PN498_14865 [Oscillatoria sp. CS-180]|uniref:hypothetical protein n=1 Tax=Oscillatoria sp. CS-180 TaxID=3021720 RepID=UPI00232E981F|nr:hypothetical protein [Oscillatoria sp. CS-180]MDB9527279.1 hypothetical protein [Oscillatoria sp. CS-180]